MSSIAFLVPEFFTDPMSISGLENSNSTYPHDIAKSQKLYSFMILGDEYFANLNYSGGYHKRRFYR
jgi:hypothetical protein